MGTLDIKERMIRKYLIDVDIWNKRIIINKPIPVKDFMIVKSFFREYDIKVGR